MEGSLETDGPMANGVKCDVGQPGDHPTDRPLDYLTCVRVLAVEAEPSRAQ